MAAQPSNQKTTSTTTRTVSSTPTNQQRTTTTYNTQAEPGEIVIPSYLKFSKVIVWLMYVWVMIGVISLSMRVFLLAFSANTATGFANFVMKVSADYLQPFRGIFTGKEGEIGYLDVSAIFAIIVYLFIAWGFHSLINYLQYKIDKSEAEQKSIGRVKKIK